MQSYVCSKLLTPFENPKEISTCARALESHEPGVNWQLPGVGTWPVHEGMGTSPFTLYS